MNEFEFNKTMVGRFLLQDLVDKDTVKKMKEAKKNAECVQNISKSHN